MRASDSQACIAIRVVLVGLALHLYAVGIALAQSCVPFICYSDADCGYPAGYCGCDSSLGPPPCPGDPPVNYGCCVIGCRPMRSEACDASYGCPGSMTCGTNGQWEGCVQDPSCECTLAGQDRDCFSDPGGCPGRQYCDAALQKFGPCLPLNENTDCMVLNEEKDCIALTGLSGCPGTKTCVLCKWSACQP